VEDHPRASGLQGSEQHTRRCLSASPHLIRLAARGLTSQLILKIRLAARGLTIQLILKIRLAARGLTSQLILKLGLRHAVEAEPKFMIDGKRGRG
jgi:hypothetical protein